MVNSFPVKHILVLTGVGFLINILCFWLIFDITISFDMSLKELFYLDSETIQEKKMVEDKLDIIISVLKEGDIPFWFHSTIVQAASAIFAIMGAVVIYASQKSSIQYDRLFDRANETVWEATKHYKYGEGATTGKVIELVYKRKQPMEDMLNDIERSGYPVNSAST